MEENNQNQNKNTTNKKRDFILNEDVKATTTKDIIMGIVDINRFDDEQQEKDPNYIRKPIHLIVNTFGGSVYEGFALTSTIDTSRTPVYTYLIGKAMSMGIPIFASGHKRFAHPLGTFMYHSIKVGLHDVIVGIEQELEQIKQLQRQYDDYILSVSNLPKHLMEEAKMMKKDWYFTAQQGLEYGLVDEIMVSTRRAQ